MVNYLQLRTSAWYGDSTEAISFPDYWNVVVIEQPRSEALSGSDIERHIRQPLGTLPLSILARGKRSVAIIVDDIQRPTPVRKIITVVLDELKRAGIREHDINIVMATSCHRRATPEDFVKKVGDDIVKKIKTLSHACDKDLTYLGHTSRGSPVYVNSYVLSCDFKVGIGGVYPHESAWFGGGSKLIHPGICGVETARHLHNCLTAAPRCSSIDNERRGDIEEVAEKVGLEFSVNVLLNHSREIVAIVSGHRVTAHREAVKVAESFYSVRPEIDADIVVSNLYPFDTSLHFVVKGVWPFDYGKDRCSKVIIASCPEGLGYHALSLHSFAGISGMLKRIRALSRHELYRYASRFIGKGSMLFFSPHLTISQVRKMYPEARLFSSWDALIKELCSRHTQQQVKVAVYPCSPLQYPSNITDY